MSLEVDAIYENGTLKLDQPLPLLERQRVKIVVQVETTAAQRAYGIMGWTGDIETVRNIAMEPEFGATESP